MWIASFGYTLLACLRVLQRIDGVDGECVGKSRRQSLMCAEDTVED